MRVSGVADARWGWADLEASQKTKADFVKSFAELLLSMSHLESRIEVLGSIEAQFSRCMLVFSPSRNEEKNPSSFASNYPKTNIGASYKK